MTASLSRVALQPHGSTAVTPQFIGAVIDSMRNLELPVSRLRHTLMLPNLSTGDTLEGSAARPLWRSAYLRSVRLGRASEADTAELDGSPSKPIQRRQAEQMLLSVLGSKRHGASESMTSATTPPRGPRDVSLLPAEDNPGNRKVAVQTLRRIDADIQIVNNGQKALNYLSKLVASDELDIALRRWDTVDHEPARANDGGLYSQGVDTLHPVATIDTMIVTSRSARKGSAVSVS